MALPPNLRNDSDLGSERTVNSYPVVLIKDFTFDMLLGVSMFIENT